MSSLAIFLIVIISVIIPKNVAGTITVQDIDVDKLIDLVNQNRINEQDSDSYDSDDSDASDSSDDSVRPGHIESENLMDLISLIVNNKNIKQAIEQKNRKHVDRASKYGNRNIRYDSNSQRTSNVALLLEQLLNKSFKDVDSKWPTGLKNFKKRLVPNRLLGDAKSKIGDDLDEYSKIYILLNPDSLRGSKTNKNALSKIISKLLSMSSSSSKREQLLKPHSRQYKGFAVKGNIARRRGRESRENSGEDAPKRGRGSGGGGAGGSGHTAIPYIRHRGENIYEKDN